MGVESLADIAFEAVDLGSLVDFGGTEFLDVGGFTDFDIPIGDVIDLGGYDIAGSFAGNATWFDTFNPGAILDSIPSIGDFSLSSITDSLPSLSDIKTFAGGIQSDFSGFVKQAQVAVQSYQQFAPLVNAASSALGIQNPVNQFIQPVSQAVGLAGAAAGVAGRVSQPGSGLVNTTSQIVSGATGFRPLTDPELAQVMRNVNPAYVNTFAAPGTAQPSTYNNAVETVQSLTPVIEGFQTQIDGSKLAIDQENKNIVLYQSQLDNPNLTDTQRADLEAKIQNSYDNIAAAQEVIDNTQPVLESTTQSYTQAADVIANTNATAITFPAAVPGQIVDQYSMVKNTDGTYSIFDLATGDTVQSGLSQQQAILQAQDLNIATPGISTNTNSPVAVSGTTTAITGVIPLSGDQSAVTAQALTTQARYQQSIRELRNTKAQSSDWRVRLRLAPSSTYLYNSGQPGILAALKITDGIIFPYTPSIETAYKANYETYDLTHSNYRGYFYKNSYVDAVNVRGTFTAQDTKEADYLLAVIHFLRSCTKMFYGQDQQRGAPPPLLYFNGYGDYQFTELPCVVSQFNYTLPPDVDYIRAQSNLQSNTNQLNNRLRNPIANNPLSYSVNRLLNSNLLQGALSAPFATTNNLANGNPTYVPTKMEISITLLPMQSRSQVSNNFSVKEFANGNLLKGGFW